MHKSKADRNAQRRIWSRTPSGKSSRYASFKKWRERNKERQSERLKAWRKANPDKVRAQKLRWNTENHSKVLSHKKSFRERHPDRVRAWIKDWASRVEDGNADTNGVIARRKNYRADPERWISKVKEWRRNNPDKVNAHSREYYHRNKARIREYLRGWKPRSPRRRAMVARWTLCDELCYICGFVLKRNEITIDHVFPSVRGGKSTIDNLMPVHMKCNSRKQDRTDFPFARPDLLIRAGVYCG